MSDLVQPPRTSVLQLHALLGSWSDRRVKTGSLRLPVSTEVRVVPLSSTESGEGVHQAHGWPGVGFGSRPKCRRHPIPCFRLVIFPWMSGAGLRPIAELDWLLCRKTATSRGTESLTKHPRRRSRNCASMPDPPPSPFLAVYCHRNGRINVLPIHDQACP